jgi:hypothetical protein
MNKNAASVAPARHLRLWLLQYDKKILISVADFKDFWPVQDLGFYILQIFLFIGKQKNQVISITLDTNSIDNM